MNKVGNNIKRILKKQNISQSRLCKITRISEPNMSKYLNGEKVPRTEVLMKIAEALKVSIEVLLGKDNEESSFVTCKNALLARSGNKLSEKEKRELINLILSED